MTAERKAGLLEGLLAVALVLVALGGVARPLLGEGGLGIVGGPLLSVSAELREPVPGLPSLEDGGPYGSGDAVELGGRATVTATAVDPDAVQRVGLVGAEVLAALTALAVLVLLLRITRTLRLGDVFVPANARRLQLVAAVVAVGATAAQALHQVGRVAVLDAASVRDAVLVTGELSLLPAFVALGIAVLAEVFRQGAALREDVEGLV